MFPLSLSSGTYGTISGSIVDGGSAISATIGTAVTGSIEGAIGTPGPAGAPGVGVPAGGLDGQILIKASDLSYDTVWVDNSAETLTATVRNETGATLTKATVVYITGAAGNKALVSKASASSEATSSKTFAILAEDIPHNQNGTAVTVGLLKSLDTIGLTEGGSLWLSMTAGQWTQTMPTAPNHAVFLGTVTRVHANQGTVEVRIQNGYELQELHNVKITSVSNGQVLKYDSSQSLWVNGTDTPGVAWGGITGDITAQGDLNTALGLKYDASNPSGFLTSSALTPYLQKAGGIITGDIQSNNGSQFRTYDGAYAQVNMSAAQIQLLNSGVGGSSLTVEHNGITFQSGKQTVHYPGTSILSGYATESWVTSQGFITSAALSPYLLSSTASATYQTIAGMSSYLTTSAAAASYYPLTGNPSSFLTAASLSGYATQSWVTSQGYITSAALSGYATQAWVDAQGYLQAGALTGYALESWVTAGFYPLTGNPSGFITSSALSGYATESWVTSQGYLTSSALTGYATESFVTSQGYLTDAPSDGNQYARKDGAWDIVSGGGGYITSVTAPLAVTGSDLSIDLTGYATESWVSGQGYLSAGALSSLTSDVAFNSSSNAGRLFIDGLYDPSSSGMTGARLNFGSSTPSQPNNGDFWTNGTDFFYALGATTQTIATQNWVGGQGYLTSSSLTGYATESWVTSQGYLTSAPVTSVSGKTGAVSLVVGDVSGSAALSGATFTGLVSTAASTTTTAGLRIPHGTAPITPVNGDIWTLTGGLFWRQNGATKQAMNIGDTQTVSGSITFSNANNTFGNSTATGVTNIASGATISGATKTVNFANGGVTGSTTNINFGSTTGTCTTTVGGVLVTMTPSTTMAGLRLPHGTAPTTPTNGDIWTTTSGLNVRINGTTQSLTNNVKAWVNFNGTGTVAIRASSNVSSITDNGVGDYTVNFTLAMNDTNYAMSGFGGDALFSVGVGVSSWGTYTQTISAFRLKVYYGTNTVVDTTNVLATFIR